MTLEIKGTQYLGFIFTIYQTASYEKESEPRARVTRLGYALSRRIHVSLRVRTDRSGSQLAACYPRSSYSKNSGQTTLKGRLT